MRREASRAVSAAPVLMFLVFAAFWTGYDVKLEMWPAIAPSAVVALALVAHAVRGRRRS